MPWLAGGSLPPSLGEYRNQTNIIFPDVHEWEREGVKGAAAWFGPIGEVAWVPNCGPDPTKLAIMITFHFAQSARAAEACLNELGYDVRWAWQKRVEMEDREWILERVMGERSMKYGLGQGGMM